MAISNDGTEARTNRHIESVDKYADRVARMSVLISWLNDEVVLGEPGKYPRMTISAVDFLYTEMEECRAEQDELNDREMEIDGADK